MNINDLQKIVQDIVSDSKALKDKHTDQFDAPVNYACVFSQSVEEFENLKGIADQLGAVIESTSTGPLYKIPPLETSAGLLRILKIRMPFPDRPERGDADFTVDNFGNFKDSYISKPGFHLISKPDFEMIELKDPMFDVLAYFSYPPIDKQLGL